ncbi:hypothetical protein HMPREF3192_01267 [Atopobium deltae]|uniref:Uncharacterized protein n=1 Tax=Atopobium deltae TaxID=1393034 RepID=A0A133XQF4_9ACTN|nr:hypothetical protein HMPREF3192_01267 [Atopobium deltae]
MPGHFVSRALHGHSLARNHEELSRRPLAGFSCTASRPQVFSSLASEDLYILLGKEPQKGGVL